MHVVQSWAAKQPQGGQQQTWASPPLIMTHSSLWAEEGAAGPVLGIKEGAARSWDSGLFITDGQ